jgi:hypothetical protein
MTSVFLNGNKCILKVKHSRNRPGLAQRVSGGLGSQISWHSAREGGEVVSLTHRAPLPPGMFLVLIFTRGWFDPRAKVRSKGNISPKNSVTPPRIDPGTVRLVAQRLNHYTNPDPNKCILIHTNHTTHFANSITVSALNVVHHQVVAKEHNVYTENIAEYLYIYIYVWAWLVHQQEYFI